MLTGKIRFFIDSRYRASRELDSGLDPALSSHMIVGLITEKLIQRARAIARGYSASYIAGSVRIRARGRLSLGKSTVLARNVTIDARCVDGISLGSATTVDVGAVLRGSGVLRKLGVGIKVGDRTAIGANNFLHGGGGITIGNDCLLGPNVTIVSENHVFGNASLPIRSQGERRAPVTVGDDVWLGAGATVLAGVTICRGAIVAAGAVVTKNVGPFEIVGGVPARRIGYRGKDGEE